MKIFRWIKKIAVIFFVSSILMVLVYRFVPVYFTPLMLMRVVEQVASGEAPKLSHKWVSIDKISPKLVRAVIASEDNLFMEHWGFDFNQIEKAVMERQRRHRARGASTISQQTAKNVFLIPQGSFVRKGFEAYFTVLIELMWRKERIMEVYLNSIEMGDGIYGAESVARLHFDKSAKTLSAGNAATIAATLPNPLRFNSARPSPYILRRKAQILFLMPRMGRIDFLEK
ncbi:MAG: monofunctional biosynthetic peptidoglycan transglycosylase [Bacteroidales bacterium]